MNILKILLLIATLPVFANDVIFDKMDKETAVTTGIYKLSDSEKEALSNWIKHSEKKAIKKHKVKNMGLVKEESERENIHSEIIGEFNGWQGKNVFKLANGQIWIQSERTSFYIPKRTNPKVTVKPKSMRSWMLYVDGFGRGVKVKRVK